MTHRYLRWDYDFPPESDRLIMRPDEYELLLMEIAKSDPKVETVREVLVVDGYLGDNIGLVAHLRSTETGPISFHDEPLVSVVSALCSALSDFKTSHRELRGHWELARSSVSNGEAFSRIFDLLISLYRDLESEYVACGVVDLAVSHTKRQAWWGAKSRLVKKLEQWRRVLTLEIESGTNLVIFRDKVEHMLQVLSNLEKREAGDTREVFVSASAYAFSCAQILLDREHPSACVMMLNRATEFLMTAVALDAGIVNFGTHKAYMTSGEDIGVMSVIRELEKAGAISTRLTNKHIFSAVNTSRNQLGFTHGLSSVSCGDAAAALSNAMTELKSIDPTLGWLTKVRKVNPKLHSAKEAVAEALDCRKLVQCFNEESIRLKVAGLAPMPSLPAPPT